MEILKKSIIETIKTWTENDIYAISLYVYDDGDNPSKPTVTLGYNTESNFQDEKDNAYDEGEARWNYAFWLQNEEYVFGYDETANIVKEWILSQGFIYNEDIYYEEDTDEEITEAFVNLLVDIVKEIHEEKILSNKFGKEIPILIHELEYYEKIAEQNIRANGEELVEDFVTWVYNQ